MCDKPFDRAAWRLGSSTEPRGDERSRRSVLVDGLVECKTLNGASRARVRKILGTPYQFDRADDGAPIWFYLVGPGALQLDSEELLVIFDEHGRVAKLDRVT